MIVVCIKISDVLDKNNIDAFLEEFGNTIIINNSNLIALPSMFRILASVCGNHCCDKRCRSRSH